MGWKKECCWWEAHPYTGAEAALQDLADAMEACAVFAHGTEREPFVDSTCCGNCGDKPFCSPNSGSCYDQKRKNYYKTCTPAAASFRLLDNGGNFYAVRRYVEDGPTGFAIIKVPTGLQGQTVSDCVSNRSVEPSKLLDSYT